MISLLFLISHPSAFAGGRHGFSIKVFTSPDDQFWANSVIIEGEHEVMLVDAQLTKNNAEKVLQEINATTKPLSIIYITHEHADHFLGLEVFKQAYPGVKITRECLRMGLERRQVSVFGFYWRRGSPLYPKTGSYIVYGQSPESRVPYQSAEKSRVLRCERRYWP